MKNRKDAIHAALVSIVGDSALVPVEKAAGMSRGTLHKKVKGTIGTKIDDVILVGEALGIDPIPVLESTGALTPRPEHHQQPTQTQDLSSIPDDEIFREAAKRRSMQAEQWDELAWAASRRRKE